MRSYDYVNVGAASARDTWHEARLPEDRGRAGERARRTPGGFAIELVFSEGKYAEGGTGSRPVRVVIAGGGIGGMALALSLHAAGFTEVDVYESAGTVMELGVGINVLPHATRELTELGLLDELYAVGIPTAELAYYSRHGQRIWSEPRGLSAGYRWPQFSIHRGALLGLLHRAVLERL